MTSAPVNLCIPRPRSPSPTWLDEESRWIRLNEEVGGNPAFFPLTVKAFYVVGLMLAACRSVSILLQDPRRFDTTYFPAYAVLASAIDLLGRCVRGNSGTVGATADVTAGFQWLLNPRFDEYEAILSSALLLTTPNSSYDISTLVSYRNFAAHGQATSSGPLPEFDYYILAEFPPLLSRALEAYWADLQSSQLPCERLANALVTPYRNRPIFETLWDFKGDEQKPYPPIGDLFLEFNWDYEPPSITLGNR